jgi:hypothetical protein
MPTNVLRHRPKPVAPVRAAAAADVTRTVVLTAGRATVRIRLLATPTADRIWQALPIHSTAEVWGGALHFETPVETGRERNARLLVQHGDAVFWCEDDRIVVAFGPTPISRPGEIRLQTPSNVWGVALDDVGCLAGVQVGAKVSLRRAVL